jgi:DNA invertase Pin-like site-specific DNA recombinase
VGEFMAARTSGAKDGRPTLDALLLDARRVRFGVVVCWRLDRLGRNLGHVVLLLEDLQHAGRRVRESRRGHRLGRTCGALQLHIIAALAEFERSRIQKRIKAGRRACGSTSGAWGGRPCRSIACGACRNPGSEKA